MTEVFVYIRSVLGANEPLTTLLITRRHIASAYAECIVYRWCWYWVCMQQSRRWISDTW